MPHDDLPDANPTDGFVLLRPWRPDDAPSVAVLLRDPEVARWTPLPQPESTEDAAAWLARQAARCEAGDQAAFAVEACADGSLVGSVDVFFRDSRRAEIGYVIGRSARRRGVGTRAVRLAAAWAFARDIDRLELIAHADNLASLRIAERTGFHREGVLRRFRTLRGEPQDLVMHSRLADDPPVEVPGTPTRAR